MSIHDDGVGENPRGIWPFFDGDGVEVGVGVVEDVAIVENDKLGVTVATATLFDGLRGPTIPDRDTDGDGVP